MILSLVAALDERNGIGRSGQLPWHLREDLRNFRRLTMNHHVLMGRKTYQSSEGKMPGRKLIVLSRDEKFYPADAQVAASLDAGIELARAGGETELFTIGGAQVFEQALPFAQRFYLTRVHTNADCDVFFPDFELSDWVIAQEQSFPTDAKNDFPFSITLLERKKSKIRDQKS